MKKIFLLIILNVSLFSSEHTIIFHGFTHHFDRVDKLGNSWNEKNWGLGYTYSTFEEKDIKNNSFYFISGVNIIKDSNSEIFPFVTLGTEVRPSFFKGYLSFNIVGMIGNKVVPTYAVDKFGNYLYEKNRNRQFLGGILPGLQFHYKHFSINYNFSPQIEFKYHGDDIYAAGFHYLTFGYTF